MMEEKGYVSEGAREELMKQFQVMVRKTHFRSFPNGTYSCHST